MNLRQRGLIKLMIRPNHGPLMSAPYFYVVYGCPLFDPKKEFFFFFISSAGVLVNKRQRPRKSKPTFAAQYLIGLRLNAHIRLARGGSGRCSRGRRRRDSRMVVGGVIDGSRNDARMVSRRRRSQAHRRRRCTNMRCFLHRFRAFRDRHTGTRRGDPTGSTSRRGVEFQVIRSLEEMRRLGHGQGFAAAPGELSRFIVVVAVAGGVGVVWLLLVVAVIAVRWGGARAVWVSLWGGGRKHTREWTTIGATNYDLSDVWHGKLGQEFFLLLFLCVRARALLVDRIWWEKEREKITRTKDGRLSSLVVEWFVASSAVLLSRPAECFFSRRDTALCHPVAAVALVTLGATAMRKQQYPTVDWLIDCLSRVAYFFGRLIDWLIACSELLTYSVDWLLDRLLDWLIDWLVDWLIDELNFEPI